MKTITVELTEAECTRIRIALNKNADATLKLSNSEKRQRYAKGLRKLSEKFITRI